MKTIYKYLLNIQDVQRFDIPDHANVLTVQVQEGSKDRISLWVEVQEDAPKKSMPIYIVGTGYPVPTEAYTYIGSVQMGYFVWHVYMGAWK